MEGNEDLDIDEVIEIERGNTMGDEASVCTSETVDSSYLRLILCPIGSKTFDTFANRHGWTRWSFTIHF